MQLGLIEEPPPTWTAATSTKGGPEICAEVAGDCRVADRGSRHREEDTLDELARLADRLRDLGALVGSSDHGTTKSLYGGDPDGLEFEVAWIVPADRLTPDLEIGTAPLDLAATIARFGGSTRGGVGVSFALSMD